MGAGFDTVGQQALLLWTLPHQKQRNGQQNGRRYTPHNQISTSPTGGGNDPFRELHHQQASGNASRKSDSGCEAFLFHKPVVEQHAAGNHGHPAQTKPNDDRQQVEHA
ncbi:hypothetical protein SDC9_211800 [bioreactor metagenome]|uniref:Uncharacterized protein n=1 Tax=bioreactor metagenome TaxID=1076179 RepID=A0A645JKB6_9ZZZZ